MGSWHLRELVDAASSTSQRPCQHVHMRFDGSSLVLQGDALHLFQYLRSRSQATRQSQSSNV